jgi:heme exporter protein A
MLQGVKLACARGGRELFGELSFDLEPGELFWVTGPNGSGKTSLCMLCAAPAGIGQALARHPVRAG